MSLRAAFHTVLGTSLCAVLSIGSLGCFDTPLSGAIACGEGELCPDGMECIARLCRAPGTIVDDPIDAAPPADADPNQPDAAPLPDASDVPLGNFGTPTVVAPGVISTTGTTLAELQDDPSVTADGLELYYNIGNQVIMVSKRANTGAAWGTPVNLSTTASLGAGDNPFISPDGLSLYFSFRDNDRQQIFVTTRPDRTANNWAAPLIFASPIDQPAPVDSLSPCLTSNKLTMIFASDRQTNGVFHLYRTTRTAIGQAWATPVLLAGTVAGTGVELDCWVSDDETVLFFGTDRDTPGAGAKLYMATGDGAGNYTNPIAVPVINDVSTYNVDGNLSPDLRTIYFARNVGTDPGDIYMSTR